MSYTDEDILAMKKVSIKVASEYTGMSKAVIEQGLIDNSLPFGSAVKRLSKYSYDIRPRALVHYNNFGWMEDKDDGNSN